MGYVVKQFNPTERQFAFYLSGSDCYELHAGICSLYLSEEDAKKVSEKEGKSYVEGNVMYCRILANELLRNNYYSDPKFQEEIYSIRLHPRDCGHYEFTDGQHRTCIAKHLNVQSMYAKVEIFERDYEINCSACHEKATDRTKKKKLVHKIQTFLKLNKGENSPSAFIDDEYMKFKKFSPKTFADNKEL